MKKFVFVLSVVFSFSFCLKLSAQPINQSDDSTDPYTYTHYVKVASDNYVKLLIECKKVWNTYCKGDHDRSRLSNPDLRKKLRQKEKDVYESKERLKNIIVNLHIPESSDKKKKIENLAEKYIQELTLATLTLN
jgi:hypothetical protein